MGGKVVTYPRRSKKGLPRKLLAILIVSFIGVAFLLYLGQALSYLQAQKELEELAEQVEMLKEENESFRQEAVLLQDEEYIEIQARRHLGMVRPGEIIFQVGD